MFMKKSSSKVHHIFMPRVYTDNISINISVFGEEIMKYLGPIAAGVLTLIIVVLVGIFSFSPQKVPAQNIEPATVEPPPVAPAEPVATQTLPPVVVDTSQLEADFAQRKATYQAQIDELDQALLERQSAYQMQIEQLNTQVVTMQNQLNELGVQEQGLLAQIVELEATRAERLPVYQTQLQQAQEQYTARYAEMQTQLSQIQTQLAQANAQLGQ
jgi:hypothetical protein